MDLESLRKVCLALPAVTEDIKWDKDLCFCIGEKMFCVASLEGAFTFSFKVNDEEFEDMISRDGIEPAPYLAKSKWVLITKPTAVSKKELEQHIETSYQLVKSKLTKKLRKELGID